MTTDTAELRAAMQSLYSTWCAVRAKIEADASGIRERSDLGAREAAEAMAVSLARLAEVAQARIEPLIEQGNELIRMSAGLPSATAVSDMVKNLRRCYESIRDSCARGVGGIRAEVEERDAGEEWKNG